MIYIFFIGVGLCILFTPQNALLDDTLQIKEANIESDDDKLNQALILVDILKTEYVKLLRQNIQLRNGDESVIEEVDQATCAANATEAPGVTGSMANDSIGNHTSGAEPVSAKHVNRTLQLQGPDLESTTGGSAPLPAGTPPSQAQPRPLVPNLTTPAAMAYYDMPMPQLPFPLHQKPFQAPRRYFRRRIPDYYYYDLPRRRLYNEPPVVGSDFRRFDYDNDPFNDTPTTVLTTTTISTTTSRTTTAGTSTTVAVTAQSTASDAQGSSDATTMPTPTPPMTSPTTRSRRTTIPASRKPTMKTTTVTRRLSVKTTASISSEIDRETLKAKVRHTPSLLTTKDPVDAEVASELVKELKKEGITIKKKKLISSTNPTTDVFDPAFKTSMRIYLEKSTRYPIPLPENHAFCYTNPNNPLCRTLIK
ncbi:uncharacterized protein isoform X2 [Choristoneura fumiferana]|uniref:uncharacterized protein isoform X2 n=1 Tax=Choristoneura fumiferana TaxID=7141 RepID=UPI003D158847